MYKVVKQSRAIQCVIIVLTFLVMLTIYPLRLWEETIPSVSNQRLAGSSDSVGEDYLLQRFIAQYDHLGTISLYVVDFQNGWNYDQRVDYFLFRMLDSDMEIMFEQQVDVRFIDIPGFCPVYINEDLEVGKDYYFFLQGVKGSRVWFGLEETEQAGTPYVSRLIYNYDEVEGHNIIGEYHYTVPLRKDKVFRYGLVLGAVLAALLAAVELFTRLTKKDRLVTVGYALRMSANGLAAVGTAAALWFVSVRRLFSGRWLDNLFYTAGIAIASVTLFYMINRKKDRGKYVPVARRWKEKGADYLQAVFFAAAIWACCNYMNGLYEIHHRVAERQLMTFLALAALVMCKKRDLWNKLTVVYAAVAAAAIIRYCSIYVDLIAMDEWDIRILRWGMAAAVLGGLLVVSIFSQLLRRRRMVGVSVWYGIVLAVFFLLLVAFRNTRWWTVAMAVAFPLFYIRYALWHKKSHLLQNINNGLLLHFLCSMLFCLVRRPFLAWIYPRYPFLFHTVTVTAVYMAFIMCAAFLALSERYLEFIRGGKRGRLVRYTAKELLLFGVAGTYMLFTASRTGFLAVGAMAVVVFALIASDMGKQKVKGLATLAGVMVLSVAWCFPMVFTAQRILPAVCGNVYQYEVEEFPDVITRGAEPDSMYFINITRFVEVFNNKIFDIPEGGATAYERSEEYQRYLAKRFNSKGEVVWDGSIEDMYAEDDLTDGADAAQDGSGAKEEEEGGKEEGASLSGDREGTGSEAAETERSGENQDSEREAGGAQGNGQGQDSEKAEGAQGSDESQDSQAQETGEGSADGSDNSDGEGEQAEGSDIAGISGADREGEDNMEGDTGDGAEEGEEESAPEGNDSGNIVINCGRTLKIIGTKTEDERAADDAAAAEREKEALEGDFTDDEEEEEPIGVDKSVYEKTEEYANGRMDIFKAYLQELNLSGHEEMGAVLPDGSLAVHAHNIYLQVAYDHGIFVGAAFVLVGAASFVQGCIYYKKRKKGAPYAALPVATLVAFAMAGLVEWIFHLCNPAGCLLMLTLAPLLFDMGGKNDGKKTF